MAMLTVRNVPDEVHRALRARAKSNGRSAEAEVRAILAEALAPESGLGSTIQEIARAHGVTDEEVDFIEASFDREPARGVDLT